jgi:hypothetical protein
LRSLFPTVYIFDPSVATRPRFSSLQAFFKLVYVDGSFLRRFHAQVNNDDAAIVPPWDQTRKRDLTFRTPVNAPQLIANLIKADCINVVESQSFDILSTGNIQVESTPIPQIPGASNFSSTATILIENTLGSSRCSITATVLVTATGPWGLTSTIEGFMATAAQQSLRQFLGFCCQEINELIRAGALEAALARIPDHYLLEAQDLAIGTPLPSLPPPLQEDAEEASLDTTTAAEFYDAEEAASTMLDLAGLQPEEVNEVLSLSLKYLFKSIDENTAILRSIDGRLERLEQLQKDVFTWKGALDKMYSKISSIETINGREVLLLAGVAVTSAAITSLFYRSAGNKTRS